MTTDALVVRVKLLRPGAHLPVRAYDQDAAFDLVACEDAHLSPGSRAVVGTGVALEMPAGAAALTLPRSGLAAEHGIALVNAPGLIDSGYRGEVRVILLNTDLRQDFRVHAGDRVAQLLILSLCDVSLVQVDELEASERGARGFGSSGRGSEPGRHRDDT
jgi:dUTP pyrophosphatase